MINVINTLLCPKILHYSKLSVCSTMENVISGYSHWEGGHGMLKEHGSRNLLIHIPISSISGYSIATLGLEYENWTMHRMPCKRRHENCSEN